MNKNYLLFFIFSMMFCCLIKCSTTYLAVYDIALTEIEKPVQSDERYGDKRIVKIKEEGINKYLFEDENIKIVWIPTSSKFFFILSNKTNHSIKILWDEAVLVDDNGLSQRVFHSGVKYIDRNNSQPPSIVVRKGMIEDSIMPSDNIYYMNGQYGGWRETPLFPTYLVKVQELTSLCMLALTNVPVMSSSQETLEEFQSKTKSYIGKFIQILLPLEINGVINEYIFTFKVNDVEVK